MKIAILIFISFLTLSSIAFAQEASRSCPTIKLIMPNGLLKPSVREKVGVEITQLSHLGKVDFQWQVSAGHIVSGQTTSSAEIMALKENAGMNITVTLRLGGLSSGCPNEFSEIIGVMPLPPIEPFDGFGNLRSDDVKARMDNFFVQINNSPHSEGFVVVTFGETESENVRLQRLQRILKAITFRTYDATRLTFVIHNEFGEPQTYFWFRPSGADLPEPSEKTTLIKGEDLIKNPKKALPKKRT